MLVIIIIIIIIIFIEGAQLAKAVFSGALYILYIQSIYLAGEKTYWNKLHFGMRRGRLGLPAPFIAVHPHRSFRLAYPLIDV